MSKQKMLAARELIQEKRYAEARALLKTIDDPTAKAWLKKLDEIAPVKKSSRKFIFVTTAVIVLSIVVIAVTLITRQNNANRDNQNIAAQVPTQMELPSETPTKTETPTSMPTVTPLPSDTSTPTSTDTAIPTNTPFPSSTPSSTSTPLPTLTHTPNLTQTARQQGATLTAIAKEIEGYQTGTYEANLRLTPTATITPLPIAQIGPIYDSLYDSQFTVEVSLQSVEFSQGQGYERPSNGNVYAIVRLILRNLGPGSLRSVSQFSFQMMDANGAVRNSTYVLFSDCDFDMVDLTAGGGVSGCVAFEVPATGQLHFIYAPFQYEGLVPGRYIDFIIR